MAPGPPEGSCEGLRNTCAAHSRAKLAAGHGGSTSAPPLCGEPRGDCYPQAGARAPNAISPIGA
eukprot:1842324-Pyramimonas_sp.AAC.1